MLIVLLLGCAFTLSAGQEHAACPMHEARRALHERGAGAMGFDQERTAHHFRLTPDGGRIEVEVKDPGDRELREQVVAHLRRISEQFAAGDFSAPLHTHGEQPPGVPALRRWKADILYTFELTPLGGRVVLSTRKRAALAAIHEFLRYQIREHGTGDPIAARP